MLIMIKNGLFTQRSLIKYFAFAVRFLKRICKRLTAIDQNMFQHVERITRGEIHRLYLSNFIQNELILLLSSKVKHIIIRKVKEAKYYSVMLDCTLDSSHQEQIVRLICNLIIRKNNIIGIIYLGIVNDVLGVFI